MTAGNVSKYVILKVEKSVPHRILLCFNLKKKLCIGDTDFSREFHILSQ